MDLFHTENVDIQESRIHLFSRKFMKKYNNQFTYFHDCEVLAGEFRRFFKIPQIPTLKIVERIAKQEMGISEILHENETGSLIGSNIKMGNVWTVVIKKDDWEGTKLFSIAHEFREIIGKSMKEIFPHFVDSKGEALESEAEAFAAALIMDRLKFRSDMEDTGFDPIALHEIYNTAYIAVTSRMATVLSGIKPSRYFWSSVLETSGGTNDPLFTAASFHRSPQYRPKARYDPPNIFFPKRGQKVQLKNNLKKCFDTQKPIFISRWRGHDFWDEYCLSAMIRPVIWGKQVSKLIVIAVPFENSSLFDRQIGKVRPIIVEEAHQFI